MKFSKVLLTAVVLFGVGQIWSFEPVTQDSMFIDSWTRRDVVGGLSHAQRQIAEIQKRLDDCGC